MICPKCKTSNIDNAKFCIKCGSQLKSQPIINQATAYSQPNKQSTVKPIPSQKPQQPRVYQKAKEYAGVSARFAAYSIDFAIFFIPLLSLIYVVTEAGVVGFGTGMTIFIYFIGWLYFALQESSSTQATIGKKMVGIYVTDMDGNRISFLRATGRYFATMLYIFTAGIAFIVAIIMAGRTARKQTLHDKISDTVVVKRGEFSILQKVMVVFGLAVFVLFSAGFIWPVVEPAIDGMHNRKYKQYNQAYQNSLQAIRAGREKLDRDISGKAALN